jgi:hypothetical protein
MSRHLQKADERFAKKYGLTPLRELLVRPLQYRWDLIERDLEILLSRRSYLPGKSKGNLPNAEVNYRAVTYLSCYTVGKRIPPQELLLLIGKQLGIKNFGIRGSKQDALAEANARRLADPTISNIKLAKAVGVDKSTVGLWVKRGLLPVSGGGVASEKCDATP